MSETTQPALTPLHYRAIRRVTRAEADLARAARRAARTTTPSAHHLAAIAQAKADLAMVREGRAAHQAECETPRLLA